MADARSLNRDITAQSARINSYLTRYTGLISKASTCERNQEPIPQELLTQATTLEADINETIRQNETSVNTLMSLREKRSEPFTLVEQQQLERHLRGVKNFKLELRRSKMELDEVQQRIQLLSSVQQEINAFKTPSGSGSNGATSSEARLLSERDNIDSSHRLTDAILEQAYDTRLEFSRQGTVLRNANARLNNVVSQIPGVHSIIRMIHMRRQRDTALLGSLTGLCTLIILWVMFG